MKCVCLIEHLREAVSLAEKIALRRSSLPILENILFSVQNKKIHLSATDLEVYFTHVVPGKAEEEGSVLVPAKTFLQFLNNYPEEKITLNATETSLVVESENLKTTFPVQNPENFPPLPAINPTFSVEFDAKQLLSALSRSFVSSGAQDFKPEFNGVFFRINEEIKIVTTDGVRLSEGVLSSEYVSKKKEEVKKEFILPKKSAQFLINACRPEEKNILLSVEENQAVFETERKKTISRLLEGKFPNYEDIVPSSFATKVYVERNELTRALKMASVFTSRLNETRLTIAAKEKTLYVNSQNELQGVFEKKIPAKIEGEDVVITFNNSFLSSGIEMLAPGEILCGFNEPTQPGFFKNMNDPNFYYLLMPLRI